MAKTILLCTVHSFTISPNLCQRTTVWNTDVPTCYITWHHQFDGGCNVV